MIDSGLLNTIADCAVLCDDFLLKFTLIETLLDDGGAPYSELLVVSICVFPIKGLVLMPDVRLLGSEEDPPAFAISLYIFFS